MIPKVIHYCWFGSKELPKLVEKCIDTWKHVLPEYELKLWDEKSFDVNSTAWTQGAYKAQKYAFVADYVRLKVLYEEGGIYLDTDIQMKKSFNDLLDQDAFIGFECDDNLSAGVIACHAGNPVILQLMNYYNQAFDIDKIIGGNMPNVLAITDYMQKNGLITDNSEQWVSGFHIYPKTYFNPRDFWGNWDFTEKTYCVHLYMGSWLSEKEQKKLERRRQPFWMFIRRIYMAMRNNILIANLRRLLNRFGII